MANDEIRAPAPLSTEALGAYDDAYVLEHCYTPAGVDRTLILVALAMTPQQRLQRAQALANAYAPYVLAPAE